MKYDLKHLLSGIFIFAGAFLFIFSFKEILTSSINYLYYYTGLLSIGMLIFGVLMWKQANEINKITLKNAGEKE
jgi:hypothetical protein